MQIKELDYGNCGIARFRGKEAYVKDMGLRTETGYKAGMAGELAQHSEAHSSAMKVNPEVVYRNNMLLPGEACFCGTDGFKSTRKTGASAAAMPPVVRRQESAEGIVAVPESVSNRRLRGVGEECGKPVRAKARTMEEEATGGDL